MERTSKAGRDRDGRGGVLRFAHGWPSLLVFDTGGGKL
jgi:hypothetical protein